MAIAYWLNDQARFVREEASRLTVWQGYPGLNLPDYPKRLWELDEEVSSLLLPASTDPARWVVRAGAGEDVLDRFRQLVRPELLAWRLAEEGDGASARTLAIKILAQPDLPVEVQRTLADLLVEVGTAADTEYFANLIHHRRAEMRLDGMRAPPGEPGSCNNSFGRDAGG